MNPDLLKSNAADKYDLCVQWVIIETQQRAGSKNKYVANRSFASMPTEHLEAMLHLTMTIQHVQLMVASPMYKSVHKHTPTKKMRNGVSCG